MDSFSYSLEDRAPLLLDDMEFPVNSLGKNVSFVKDFDLKGFHDSDKTVMILDEEKAERANSVESVFPHIIREFLVGNHCLPVDNSVLKIPSASVFSLDQFTQDLVFGSKHSDTDHNQSDKKEFLTDSDNITVSKQGHSRVSSEESRVSSFGEDSVPGKRGRTVNLHTLVPLCQVQGCYKDLSFSKDYYKRHRVCDTHSKSAKVVIKGIEKRFCQQCSRFHLLKEFDDVKRSCRKRLAGHNERRRKPQFGPQFGASSSYPEMDILKTASFLLTEERPAGFFYQEKYVENNQSKRMRLEKMPGAVKFEFPGPLASGCAPSLLSFESKNLPNASLGNPEVLYPAYTSAGKNSSKSLGPSSLNSLIQIGHFTSGITRDQGGTPMLHDGLAHTSDSAIKDCRSPEVGTTVDLLHLSSHLRRVLQQQNSVK